MHRIVTFKRTQYLRFVHTTVENHRLNTRFGKSSRQIMQSVAIERKQHDLLTRVLMPIALEALEQNTKLAVIRGQLVVVPTFLGDGRENGQKLPRPLLRRRQND